jgi:glycosyltransferase involved in cell wall biosynthesis
MLAILTVRASCPRARSRGGSEIAQIVVLLPVRNGEAELPSWFQHVSAVADAVVALDDGSTDHTVDLLEAEPLVRTVLRNPVRASYAGWDDAANRQRLVDAVAPLAAGHAGVTWTLQIDADEALAPGDAAALRHAVANDALDPTRGHLLRVLRVVVSTDGTQGYDQDHLWVGRLFAWHSGATLPTETLHLVPLPTDLAPAEHVWTTLRILHYGSYDDTRRRARFAKYAEVDPENRWQADYTALLAGVDRPKPIAPRPPNLPVVPHEPWPGESEEAAAHPAGEPLLTVVIISRDDEAVIARAVDGVLAQACDVEVQVVVVTSGTDRTAAIVRARYPEVELVVIDHPALPGEARNAGLAVARGRYVTFPGSHIELLPGSLSARLDAHRAGWGMVTCTTKNGTRTPAGWASYFLDHSGGLPGRPSHIMTVSPSYASYLTEAIRFMGGFPEHLRTAEDTVANTTLFDLGYGAWRAQDAAMTHHSPCRSTLVLVRHHHQRGRGLGAMLRQRRRAGTGLLSRGLFRGLGPRYLVGRLRRVHANTWRYGGDLRWRWLAVSPLAALGIGAAWLGAWREILEPRRGWWDDLFAGRPGLGMSRWR